MKKLSNKLYRVVNNKILIISIAVFVLFLAIAAPLASNYMDKITDGAPAPDTTFDYEAEDLLKMAQDYGPEGRRAYILMRFTFDLAFPIVYLFFLVAASTKLLSYLPKKSRFRCFNIIPFFAAGFDFMENILTAVVMGMYPKEATLAAQIAPYASMIKWMFVGISFALVAVLALYRIIMLLKNRKQA